MNTRGLPSGLVIAALAGASILLVSCMSDRSSNDIPFEASAWKSADTLGSSVRCDMVDDLQNTVGLTGLTKPEVVELLGTPDSHDDAGPLHYHLCPSSMDVYILELRFDDGRVVSAKVRDT